MIIIVVPSILAIYMLLDIHVSICHQNVAWIAPRLCQKQSEKSCKFKIYPGGVCSQTPLVATHAYAHATIILLPSCFSPQL